MPATTNIKKSDRGQQGHSCSRAITVLDRFHISIGDGLMLKWSFFSDLQRCLFTVIERQQITSPQCCNVGVGNEHVRGSVLPLRQAIVNGRDPQATQFQYASADPAVVPQGVIESLEARPEFGSLTQRGFEICANRCEAWGTHGVRIHGTLSFEYGQ